MKRLETERLNLRKFVIDDAEMMYENWATDIETVKHLEWDIHSSLEETKEYLENVVSKYEKGKLNWAIEEKDTKKVIGNISVFNVDLKNNTCEIGYAIGSNWHGKGYGTEVLKTVLNYLKNEKGFYMIISECSSENPASKRIMEKANMNLDAVLKNRLKGRFGNDRADIYTFSY